MSRLTPFLATGLLLLLIFQGTWANTIDDVVYKNIPSAHACTRWLSTRGQIGCSTPSDGAYGILYPLETMEDVEKLANTKLKHSRTIAVLNGTLLTPQVVKKLEAKKQITGVVVITGALPANAYSETSPFPQANTTTAGEDGKYLWNIANHDVLHHEYRWPMWSVNTVDGMELLSKAKRNVAGSTRFGVNMKQFMYAYKDAVTCLRHGYCEPVGGHSVWGALPMPSSLSKRSVVMTLTRLDTVSVFAEEAIGANSDMSGLVANLAALTTLAGIDNLQGNPPGYRAVDPSTFIDPIVWAFFDAESWGYAGSTRFLKDWTDFKCITGRCTAKSFRKTFQDLSLDNVKQIVEVRQAGALQPDGSRKLWVHQHHHQFHFGSVITVLDSAQGLDATVATASPQTPGLPPSSAFTFLNAATAAGKTELANNMVVIADHNEHYTNRYYGSRYDTRANVDLNLLTDAATILARTLYMHAAHKTAEEASFIKVNSSLVATWLTCVTEDSNCPLAKAFTPGLTKDKVTKPSHYHGPFFDNAVSSLGKLIHDYMVFVGRNRTLDAQLKKCEDDSECGSTETCVIGKCMNSLAVNYHDSYSTGLEPLPKGGWRIVNPKLENWVESYWDNPQLQQITVRNGGKEGGFFFAAICQTVLFIALLIVFKRYFANKYELIY